MRELVMYCGVWGNVGSGKWKTREVDGGVDTRGLGYPGYGLGAASVVGLRLPFH
jgi:hypothetical protein